MLLNDVRRLTRVELHIEQGVRPDEAEPLIADGEVDPLVLVRVGAGLPAALVSEQVAIQPLRACSFNQRQQTAAFNLVCWNLRALPEQPASAECRCGRQSCRRLDLA